MPGPVAAMKKRTWILGAGALLAMAGIAAGTRSLWSPQGAVAQAPPVARAVPVEVAQAVRKPTPVRIEALGTVTTMASVALKSRVETEIVSVHFVDGARVNQ